MAQICCTVTCKSTVRRGEKLFDYGREVAAGSAEALHAVADHLTRGVGVARNASAALRLLRRAARTGDLRARFEVRGGAEGQLAHITSPLLNGSFSAESTPIFITK